MFYMITQFCCSRKSCCVEPICDTVVASITWATVYSTARVYDLIHIDRHETNSL